MEIKIWDRIKAVCPNITLACIEARIEVEDSCESLLKDLEVCEKELLDKYVLEDIAKLPRIKDSREVYKSLGKAPSKYRVSSEALMRRILQKKGIYKINNIVEINNLISLKTHFSVGSYNLDNLKESIYLTVGGEGESYKGIGKDTINIANLPVMSDTKGPFGSPTSDSERAMITKDTKHIMMCIYSFSGEEHVDECLDYGKKLLEKYANGKDISTKIIK